MKIRKLSLLMVSVTLLFISMPVKAQLQYIVFGSDVHSNVSTSPNVGVVNLNSTTMRDFWNISDCDFLGLAGDQTRRTGTDAQKASDYQAITNVVGSFPLVSIKGNHDIAQSHNTSSGWYYDKSEFAHVFVLSPEDFINGNYNDLNWMLLNSYYWRDGKMLIIMSHYPLHSRRLIDQDGISASSIDNLFNLLVSYSSGDNPLDIVYVWGHTHGKKNNTKWWDTDIQMCALPSETILKSDGTFDSDIHNSNVNTMLTFTYLNAGYLGGESPNTPSMSRLSTGEGALCYYQIYERSDGSLKWMYRRDPSCYLWCD